MLDSAEYRLSESAAKGQIKSWWIAQTHYVDHFEKSGFPVRPNYFFEIGQLLDTMQENRFELFIDELNGLSVEDESLLRQAIAQCIDFQLINFPRRDPIIPVSTMISSLALYKKLSASTAGNLKILEVGPGCGYLSFFASRDPRIAEYSQVEAAESFYILQNRINNYCYGAQFLDFAHQFDRADFSFNARSDFEMGGVINGNDIRDVRCTHFPWWMLGLLASRTEHYDIVTSNANLNEFSRPALRDYLSIFQKVLKPEGLFIVQCTGFTAHGSLETLFDELHEHGFAPLISTIAGEVPDGSDASKLVFGKTHKYFTLNNLVMVKSGHPHYNKRHDRAYYENGSSIKSDVLNTMYARNDGERRYGKEEFMTSLINDLTGDRNRITG